MINRLIDVIKSHGDRGAVVSYSRIKDLRRNMLDLRNGEFHTEWIDRMANHIISDDEKYIPPDINFEPQSIITITIPNPKVLLEFRYKGISIPCILPPHYSNWHSKNEQALHYLQDYLSHHGYSVAMVITLPQKMLAVHTGLALYGRNNICYSPEFGSHMQIMTYISDFPCTEDVWLPLQRMEACDKCNACVTSCPTGVISYDHHIINSDKCITLVNEFPENYPNGFPEWINEKAHNSIIGCSICQDCCPCNAHNEMNTTAGVKFTEEETMEVLNNNNNTSYTDSVSAKLITLGMLPEYTKPLVLSRNLTALVNKMFS